MPDYDPYSDVGVISRTPQSELHLNAPGNIVWIGDAAFQGGRQVGTFGQSGLEPQTNDLISRAVSARQNIEWRRQQLMDEFPRNRRDQVRWKAEMGALNIAQHGIEHDTGLALRANELAARRSERDLAFQRKSAIDSEAAGAMSEMIQAHAALQSGQITKEDYDNVLLGIPERYPLGITHGAAANHLRFASEVSDKQEQYRQRVMERNLAMTARKYGVGIQTDDAGEVSPERTQQAIMQTPQWKNEQLGAMNKELFNRYGIGTGIGSIFNPIEGHQGGTIDEKGMFTPTDPSKGKQTHIGIPFVDKKTGQTLRVGVPIPIFNQIKADFGDAYSQISGAGGPSSMPTQVGSLSPTAPAPAQPHPQDQAAIAWANANPNDPRAQRILQLNQ